MYIIFLFRIETNYDGMNEFSHSQYYTSPFELLEFTKSLLLIIILVTFGLHVLLPAIVDAFEFFHYILIFFCKL